jgi:cation diffusion facilitator family transporter
MTREDAEDRKQNDDTTRAQADRMRAGRLALVVGTLIFLGKLLAYLLTGSTAVFADAMESTINIVSAGMLVLALAIAARPPDSSHPYGHGKVEFLSAGIEGAAITFAALVIFGESIRKLIEGGELHRLDLGLSFLAVTTVANALLGRHLVRVGERASSDALVADGRHVLTDVWTSVGVIGGLIVVSLTGWSWADPAIAIAVAANVAWEGYRLLHASIKGLMDEADEDTLEAAARILDEAREPAWIDLHGLRSWRSGARRHYDMHLTVPRYFDVEEVHAVHDRIEEVLLADDQHGSDVVVHFDPCRARECPHCRMSECPIRQHAFEHTLPFSAERAVLTDEIIHSEGDERPARAEAILRSP